MTAKSDEVRYSFIMCNLDMEDTLATSALSLITQLPEDSELVIIDGGSTDGSKDIIENLVSEFDNVRAKDSIFDTLGQDRNLGSRIASGEIVIHQFDCDDFLYYGSVDRLLDRIEDIDGSEDKWFLRSSTFNVAPKDVFVELGYGKTNRAEDKELWRRVEQDNEVSFYSDSPNYCFTLIEDSKIDKIKKDILGVRGDVRNGLDLDTVVYRIIRNENFSLKSKPFRILNAFYQYKREKFDGFLEEFRQYRRRRIDDRQKKHGIHTNLDSVHVREEKKSRTDAHIARDMEAML